MPAVIVCDVAKAAVVAALGLQYDVIQISTSGRCGVQYVSQIVFIVLRLREEGNRINKTLVIVTCTHSLTKVGPFACVLTIQTRKILPTKKLKTTMLVWILLEVVLRRV